MIGGYKAYAMHDDEDNEAKKKTTKKQINLAWGVLNVLHSGVPNHNIVLQTFVCGALNRRSVVVTKKKKKKKQQKTTLELPIFYNLFFDLQTGTALPGVAVDSAEHFPLVDMRAARGWSPQTQPELLSVWNNAQREYCFGSAAAPFTWHFSHDYLRYFQNVLLIAAAEDESRVLAMCSTSPDSEPEHFVANLCRAMRFALQYATSAKFLAAMHHRLQTQQQQQQQQQQQAKTLNKSTNTKSACITWIAPKVAHKWPCRLVTSARERARVRAFSCVSAAEQTTQTRREGAPLLHDGQKS
jgi:hypothetical protein